LIKGTNSLRILLLYARLVLRCWLGITGLEDGELMGPLGYLRVKEHMLIVFGADPWLPSQHGDPASPRGIYGGQNGEIFQCYPATNILY
jgi:hypothetical protein